MAQTPRGRLSRSSSFSNDSISEAKISLREEIALRKEKEKKEFEDNITFKPQLFTSKYSIKDGSTPSKDLEKSLNASQIEKENRFDKLYADALKRHINSQSKPDDNKELTFTPKLTQKGSRSRSSSRTRDGADSDTESIYSRSRSRSSSRSRAPEKDPDCTFKPQITKRGRSVDRGPEKSSFSKRLYEDSTLIKEKLEKKLEESVMRELEECTFKPTISRSLSASRTRENPNTPSKSSEKVDIRLHKDNEERRKRLEESIKKYQEELASSTPFKPTLSTATAKIVSHKEKDGDNSSKLSIFDRLSIPFHRNIELPPEEKEQLTFKPIINSKRAPSPSPRNTDDRVFSSVHERLFVTGIEKIKESEIERQQLLGEKDNEYTFSPKLSSTYKIKKEQYNNEDVFKRLTSNDQKEELKERLEKLRQELTKDQTFTPSIPESSKYISQRKEGVSLFDRLVAEDNRVKSYIARQQEIKAKEELENVTFSPSLPEKSKDIIKRMGYVPNFNANTISYSNSVCDDSLGSDSHNSISTRSNSSLIENVHSVVKSEKEIQQIIDRLSVVRESSPRMVQSKIPTSKVVSSKNVDDIINRLASKSTKSFEASLHNSNQIETETKPLVIPKTSIPRAAPSPLKQKTTPTIKKSVVTPPPVPAPELASVKVVPRKKKQEVDVEEKTQNNEIQAISSSDEIHNKINKTSQSPRSSPNKDKGLKSPKKEVTKLPVSNIAKSSVSNTISASKPAIFKSNIAKPKLDFSLQEVEVNQSVQEPIVEINGNVKISDSEILFNKVNDLSVEEEFNSLEYMSGESSDDQEIEVKQTSTFQSHFEQNYAPKVFNPDSKEINIVEDESELVAENAPPSYSDLQGDLPKYSDIFKDNLGEVVSDPYHEDEGVEYGHELDHKEDRVEEDSVENVEDHIDSDHIGEHIDSNQTGDHVEENRVEDHAEDEYGNEFELNDIGGEYVDDEINNSNKLYNLTNNNSLYSSYQDDIFSTSNLDNNDNLLDTSSFSSISKTESCQETQKQSSLNFNSNILNNTSFTTPPAFDSIAFSGSGTGHIETLEQKIASILKLTGM